MSYERPAWAAGGDVPQNLPAYKVVNIDVGELIRTRDALTSAYLGLSNSLDRAVKAYLDHTQVVLNGDAALNVSHLMQPFNVLSNLANPAQQVAQMALQQNGNGPMVMGNGMPNVAEDADGKKKRKKRAYKQRDPNAPKRPLTAYFRYLGENRSGIAKEIQDSPEKFTNAGKPGDISKIATDRWNALTKDQQEPYRAAYKEALKEYEKKVDKYKAAGGLPGAELDGAKIDDSIAAATVGGAAEKAADSDASDSDKDDDDAEDEEDDDEDEEPTPPPPPPVEKSPKKSTLKKGKSNAAPAPGFSSINTEAAAVAATAPIPSSDRKRKSTGADADTGSKKRGKRSSAKEEVVAAPDPVASSPEVETTAAKKKKDKKKRKSDVA